ncbi:MAG: DoxX family protein [Candidatus Polarisedimenticolia bacterium]
MEARSRRTVWIGRVITGIASLAFLAAAAGKFVGGPQLEEGMTHLGFPMSMVIPLAILEVSCAVIYLIPATSVVGAILLTGFMGGAICTHWRVGESIIAQTTLILLVWLGLYLREIRLKDLIPIRRR